MVGKNLSHYKILEELGRGGMGIVYKAEDTKLDRTVAIKVLPSAALASEDDRARFYREAKAAAQLHHPHIASVFEIDEAVPEGFKNDDLRPFISMEYIEGDTLDAKIRKGPLKLEEAVLIASQIASGLEAAHEKDIVHRDLKSQNVMLTKKGEAKILDFGLAQTAASTKLTRIGSTLGTVAYMSPEQARGEEVDRRTDIWSLGVVLYEMIAGRSPFPGEYDKAVIYNILNQDPEPLTAVRTGVPMGLEWIASKCLAKNADRRYQSATEVIVDLDTVDLTTPGMSRTSISSNGQPGKTGSTQKSWGSRLVVGILVGVVLGVLIMQLVPTATPLDSPRPIRTEITFESLNKISQPAISRNGSHIAFVGWDSLGQNVFYRSFETGRLEMIPDSQDGESPQFSPDGSRIAFTKGRNMYIASIDGGSPIESADVSGSIIRWHSDNNVYFYDTVYNIWRINPDSEEREQLIDKTSGVFEWAYRYPVLLPDNESLLFSVQGSLLLSEAFIRSVKLSTADTTTVINPGYGPVYLPTGHLLFSRIDGIRMRTLASGFDVSNLSLTGARRQILNVSPDGYDVSDTGTLVHTDPEVRSSEIVIRDSNGLESVLYSGGIINYAQIRPDGGAIWLFDEADVSRSKLIDLTSGDIDYIPGTERMVGQGFWSPDGSSAVFSSFSDGSYHLEVVDTSGRRPPTRLWSHEHEITVTDWGVPEMIAYYVLNPDSRRDIWVYSFADSTSTVFAGSPRNERNPIFSQSGDWLIYSADSDVGGYELEIVPFPQMGAQPQRLTTDGGSLPRLSPDQKTLYYWNSGALYSLDIDLEANQIFSGRAEKVFEGESSRGNAIPHPDGRRMIFIRDKDTSTNRIHIVQHWFTELRELVPMTN